MNSLNKSVNVNNISWNNALLQPNQNLISTQTRFIISIACLAIGLFGLYFIAKKNFIWNLKFPGASAPKSCNSVSPKNLNISHECVNHVKETNESSTHLQKQASEFRPILKTREAVILPRDNTQSGFSIEQNHSFLRSELQKVTIKKEEMLSKKAEDNILKAKERPDTAKKREESLINEESKPLTEKDLKTWHEKTIYKDFEKYPFYVYGILMGVTTQYDWEKGTPFPKDLGSYLVYCYMLKYKFSELTETQKITILNRFSTPFKELSLSDKRKILYKEGIYYPVPKPIEG